jgi:hypothetical protein
MVYLHIAQCPDVKVHSPLDTLYGSRKWVAHNSRLPM